MSEKFFECRFGEFGETPEYTFGGWLSKKDAEEFLKELKGLIELYTDSVLYEK